MDVRFEVNKNKIDSTNDIYIELIDNIKREFITKNSLSKLINNITNKEAAETIVSMYTEADTKWSDYINQIGNLIVSGCLDKDFNVTVNFDRHVVEISFNDLDNKEIEILYNRVQDNGWNVICQYRC